MKHIYSCIYLKNEETLEITQFEEIFKNNISKQMKVNRVFFEDWEKREKMKNESNKPHVILQSDPLFSIFEYGNGL